MELARQNHSGRKSAVKRYTSTAAVTKIVTTVIVMPSSNDFAGGHERQADSQRGESQHEHRRQPDHKIHQGQSFFRSGAENGAIEIFPPCPARRVPPNSTSSRCEPVLGIRARAIRSS